MVPSSKIQPDRPIWPAAPAQGNGSDSSAPTRSRNTGHAAASSAGIARPSMTTSAQAEGFGSFSG